jgi:hypothetical protein
MFCENCGKNIFDSATVCPHCGELTGVSSAPASPPAVTKQVAAGMKQKPTVLDRELGKRIIRVVLSIVGLLILRAILAALPMMKNASSIGGSLLTPLVLAHAIVDTAIFLLLLRFGFGLGNKIRANFKLPDMGGVVSMVFLALVLVLAYSSYETVTACLLESPSNMLKGVAATQGVPAGMDAATAQMLDSIRQASQGIIAESIGKLPGTALAGYQQMAVLALRQSPDIYGWTFLALIAIPVVFIVLYVSRNMDAITELAFHAASTGGAGQGTARVDPIPSGDPADKLKKLKALLDSGVISREDFETQKAVILGSFRISGEPAELQKLKALLDAGVLSEQEYNLQKERFLRQLGGAA